MEKKDKITIKHWIASGLKQIPNDNFTISTLGRIENGTQGKRNKELELNDNTLMIPLFLFAILKVSFYIIILLGNLFGIENPIISVVPIGKLSFFLTHPVTISIMVSFTVLYALDIFLAKEGWEYTNWEGSRNRGEKWSKWLLE